MVELFNISARSPNGPNKSARPCKQVPESFSVVKLRNGGLAAGAIAPTVDLSNNLAKCRPPTLEGAARGKRGRVMDLGGGVGLSLAGCKGGP